MTHSDDFSRDLLDRIDAVRPALTVDTTRVVSRARRRRATTRTSAGLAVTLVLAGTGWALALQPWQSPDVVPAGNGVLRVAGEDGADPDPDPSEDLSLVDVVPVDPGWPDAPYWHTIWESTDAAGEVERMEFWAGHTEPGLLVFDDDLANASGVGPGAWGNLLIDGAWVLIGWDALYALPTEPVALEAVIRGSVEPDRGVGTDDDKVVSMARDLLLRTPASPALRTALWTVMAAQPSSSVTPGVSDAAGRTGSLFEHTDALGGTFVMVFDPVDGRLLEERGLDGAHATMVEEGPATDTPIEPTLESSGCTAWATC
ncbi:hypothetical protein [Pengzhenrongella frigida]|uniref:Uncharacterized protein n=1 Tax=Pengzhenrongella frigida TaxID=1259133 RepID=A0A4Q5N0S4_9MICO|nr:hypothetical protein [Cellulomonas sp. HLT2-17]RYV51640.1 hypothetical protein EUA98_06970 [Cellulomonas sp. HLT2-17]